MGAGSTYGGVSANVRSKLGVGVAVYAVVKQESGTTQHLVAAKARLAKRGLFIPHLEMASRGELVNGSTLWWNGPKWLANREEWPPNPVTSACPAIEVEVKAIREVLPLAQPKDSNDRVEEVLEKHELKHALRVVAWVTRFITNCKTPKKLTGPLTADELENVKWGWIRRVQRQATMMPNYPQVKSS